MNASARSRVFIAGLYGSAAALLLGLSALVWQSGKVGAWVLLIGGMRYLFVGASRIWPALAPSSAKPKPGWPTSESRRLLRAPSASDASKLATTSHQAC